MYGWTDPNEPDGAHRRPEPPIDEPSWLTDRPAPRSAYLFGDDPDEPAVTGRDGAGYADAHTGDRGVDARSGEPTDRWTAGPGPRDEWSAGPGPADRYAPEPEPRRPWSPEPHHQWASEPAAQERWTADDGRDGTGGWATDATGWYGSGGAWRADEPTGPRSNERPGAHRPADEWETGRTDGWETGRTGAGWSADDRRGDATDGWRHGSATGFGGYATGGWSDERSEDAAPGYAAGGSAGDDTAYGVRAGGWDAGQDPRRDAGHDPRRDLDATAPLYPVSSARDTGWPTDTGGERDDAWHVRDEVASAPGGPARAGAEESPRSRRRLPRPLLIGGAAAAATLVVSLGVGALALPGGDEPATPSAVDDTVAEAPVAPTDEAPAETLTAPSPTASPSTARPTPSASRSVRPTPKASRTTAPSRRTAERSTPPSTRGATTATTTAPAGSVSAQAREVVDLVNAERAKAGCGAVSIDDKLMTAAQRHSQDQADHQNMSHTGSDGSDPGDRIDRVGYEWRTYGENVAWNQKTPAAVMDAWMNSPGHRANILNCAFTEIGVGIATSNGPYWTQVFAAPR